MVFSPLRRCVLPRPSSRSSLPARGRMAPSTTAQGRRPVTVDLVDQNVGHPLRCVVKVLQMKGNVRRSCRAICCAGGASGASAAWEARNAADCGSESTCRVQSHSWVDFSCDMGHVLMFRMGQVQNVGSGPRSFLELGSSVGSPGVFLVPFW